MSRLALLLTLPLLACGDDAVTADTGGSSGATATTTGVTPTTGTSDGSSSTGDGSSSTGSGGQTGSTSSSTSTSSSSSGSSSESTGTTEAVDPSSTDTTGDGTSTGDSTTGSSSTGEASTGDSSTGDSSTGDDTEGMQPLLSGTCVTQDFTSFSEPMSFEHELHIVGVYQPTNGQISVAVDRVGVPLTLVLSSYEPVAFTLALAPGVELVEVVLNGYNGHTVQGHGAATVTDKTLPGNYLSACAYVWPDDDQGCDTPGLVSGAQALTGLTLSSFAGCYEGAAFTLE